MTDTKPTIVGPQNTIHSTALDPQGGAKLKTKKQKTNEYSLPPPLHVQHDNTYNQLLHKQPPHTEMVQQPFTQPPLPPAQNVPNPMPAPNIQARPRMQVPPPPAPPQNPILRLGDLPKMLKYDGRDSWNAFQMKFQRYAEMRDWTPAECRDNLCFCLEGKASEYYSILLQRDGLMGFRETMQKLEKRFGFAEIPETAQIKLQSLKQNTDKRITETEFDEATEH